MEATDLEEPELTCVEAFKQGDHDKASQLLPSLQQPAAVRTSYNIPRIPRWLSTDVTLLHLAALNGWMDIVAIVVDKYGCSSQCWDSHRQTPLHYAAYGGSLLVIKYLITEQHCDPISKEQYGRTPLHCAGQNGHMNIIHYLITELGCDPALPDTNGEMPIHYACLGGQLSVVKYLITEQYCDPNSRGQYGSTPLHYACENGHMDVIQYLVTEQGCDPVLRNNKDDMPIHFACCGGQLNVVKYLVTVQHCDPNSRGQYGRTPLHCACKNGHMNVIQLITELGCDPALPDSNGDLPIHDACRGGRLSVVKYLITEQFCDPNSSGQYGSTPLHYACENDHMNVIQYLITEQGCDPVLRNNKDDMPIHFACIGGQLNVVKYLIIEQLCDPNSRGQYGRTPLHIACINGHMNVIQYLITELGCDPALPDSNGDLPIHDVCRGGRLSVVKYLITEQHCDPNSRGQYGRTPLHYACENDHMNIIQYLIIEQDCDPTVVDSDKKTPLHTASYYGHTHVVQWLLQDGRVDALSADNYGHTPVDCAEFSDNSYHLLKVFHPLLKSRKDYPIHSFTKIVFTGNSGVGKSSLAHIIVEQSAMGSHLYGDVKDVEITKVETLTAGIDSYILKSETVGNMVLYDLAGQSEYYFSQSVIMETVMQNTPAIFINLVDLNKNEEEIAQAVHYWLTFVENATFKTKGSSCIVMVGSHIDLLSEDELLTKTTLVEDLIDRRVKKLKYEGFVGMDCRGPNDNSIERFFSLLSHCQSTISTYSPPVSLYCHMLYSFLQTKLDKIACQFRDLISHFSTEEESLIPPNKSLIDDLLEYLSDKGLIIYLKNNQCLEKSWVVVKREVILKDINGVLFAPKYFRGYHPIASSTGIIRMSTLTELFPQYDPEMLVELMVRVEFCHVVNLSNVSTNLQPIIGSTTSVQYAVDNLLFFPCLLHAERPQALTREFQQSNSQQVGFGWCLGCMDYEYQFLTSRFLHVLLLRLAYTFPLPSKGYSKGHILYGLEQRCTVWTNGILWTSSNGIRTVVEIIQQNRWVVVTMYHNKDITRPVEYSKHRSAVIRLVLDLQKELAPYLDTLECLISPSLLQQWPLERLTESELFTITDVASSILCHSSVFSYKDGSNQLSTKEALFFEPYYLLSPSSVCELMDSSRSDQPVSSALLNEVRECCQQPQLESQSHLSLRKHLDNMSIFSGRNPLIVAELDPDDIDRTLPVEELALLSKVPDGTLDDSHLSVLVTALSTVYQWFPLGIHLGLSYSNLKVIDGNQLGQILMCKIDMLALWLKGPEEKRNKQFLQSALQQISPNYMSDDEAMDKLGYNVTVSITNVTTQGPPATGKTSVIDLAMGRPPVDRHSTGVAEPPSCSIVVGNDSSEDVEWEELTPDKMLDMVCETIEALAEPVNEHLGTEPSAMQHETGASQHDTIATLSDPLPPSPPPPPSHSPPPHPPLSSPPPSPLGQTPAKHKRDFPQILKDIMQQLPEVRGSTSLFHARLLLMSDSGGQPNYLDVFPLFARNKCLALLILKLNEPLHAIPQFSYCIQGHPISMADTMLQYSHEQLLESLAKSIYSFLPSLSPSSHYHGSACFAVIGTFADKMDECVDESLEDKNTSLARSLKAYKQLQINNKGKAIFPINAVTSDKEQRKKYMMELRQLINKASSVNVTIKLRWFGFYLSLLSQAEQKAILSLQECLDIGRSLDMDEQETRKAITFFHNLNLILHYQTDELDSIVILELKPIFDLVSLLIGVSFFNEDELHDFFGIDLPPDTREQFQQHGCFDRQTLEECFQFPDQLNAKAFINLLVEVKAAAIIEKSNSFFMPCVLRYASKEEESKIIEDQHVSYPWIVRLKIQSSYQELYLPLPPSFSLTLIVLLLSSPLFSIDNCQQYRNIFILHYNKGGVIIIVKRWLQLEIYYSFSDSECSDIRFLIREAILDTEKRLGFDVDRITIEDSFPCSCSSSPQRESRHILYKSTLGPPRADCELTKKRCQLTKQELRWLPPDIQLRRKDEDFPSDPLTVAGSSTLTGFLSRVDVHGETVLEVVGDKPQKLEWPGYGFYIDVPEGALPPGVTACVHVKAILGGQFKFPENSRLISALYWISSSEVFRKEVAVNIEHCAVIKTKEQCSSFKFIIAKCSQTAVPYTFRERGGDFNPHSQYGTIKLKRFCVVGETSSTDTKLCCTALMFYKKQTTCPFVADFHFVVVKNLKSYRQRVDKDYQGWSKDNDSLTLYFKINTTIQLNQEEQKTNSWRIVPLKLPLQVTNDDVSNFEEGRSIPHCSFELRFECCCGLKIFFWQRLFHRVHLDGTSSPGSFCIRYPQPDENKVQAVPSIMSTQPRSHHLSNTLSYSQHEQALAAARDQSELDNHLSVKELLKVCESVTDWHTFGIIYLDLPMAKLENIRLTNQGVGIDRCKSAMFQAWINSKHDASWSDLITALSAHTCTVASDVNLPTTDMVARPGSCWQKMRVWLCSCEIWTTIIVASLLVVFAVLYQYFTQH